MSKGRNVLSGIGLALGAGGLLLAIVHMWAGPFAPQPTLEERVADKAAAIRDATVAKLRGEEPEAAPSKESEMDADRIAGLATALLGASAIVLGVVGFARKEPLRAAGGSAALGGIVLAFQFAVIALGLIVVAILVMGVLAMLGSG